MGRPTRAGRWKAYRSFPGADGEQQQGWEDGSWAFHGTQGGTPLVEGAPCPSCRLGCSTVLDALSATRQEGQNGLLQDRYLASRVTGCVLHTSPSAAGWLEKRAPQLC